MAPVAEPAVRPAAAPAPEPRADGAAPRPILRPLVAGERRFGQIGDLAAGREELARVAAGYVEPGSTVALDDSDAALAMVPHLLSVERLVIVTNALRVVAAASRATAELILLPGVWDAQRRAFCGAPTLQRLAQLRVDRCFLSVASVSVMHGACHDDGAMADVRRAMAGITAERVLLVEGGALHAHAQHHVADLATFDLAVVSADVSAADRAALRLAGPLVATAPTP